MTSKAQKNNQEELNSEEITIERCLHDKENPYVMINRDLIREKSLSIECIWLITYLLSMKDGWKISPRQIINHLQGRVGKNKVYKLIDEACNAGYMKKEDYCVTNERGGKHKRTRYLLSEFKKFNQLPENRDPGNGDNKKEESLRKNNRITTTSEKAKSKVLTSVRSCSSSIYFSHEDQRFIGITDEVKSDLMKTFPNVDIDQQIKEMILWLKDHPERIGNKAFITKWLRQHFLNLKDQNKTPPIAPPPPKNDKPLDINDIDPFIIERINKMRNNDE